MHIFEHLFYFNISGGDHQHLLLRHPKDCENTKVRKHISEGSIWGGVPLIQCHPFFKIFFWCLFDFLCSIHHL